MYTVPRETQRFLKRFGGVNPYKQPQWRLIVSAERLIKEAGVWRDWADGLSTAEKGGLNFSSLQDQVGVSYERHQNKPLRVVTEMRETQKYPQSEGWILEKWFPASSYGSQEEWYSYKAIDGYTPMLGPYPETGDYEYIFGPWTKLPTTDMLQSLISRYSSGINNRKGTPAARASEYMQRAEYAEQKADELRKHEYEARFRDVLSPMKSGSLAASRWRQDLAARTGNTEHIGIIS